MEQAEKKKKTGAGRRLGKAAAFVLGAAAAFVLAFEALTAAFTSRYVVSGGSMEPFLSDGDRIRVDTLFWKASGLKRYDVVAAEMTAGGEEKAVVKRVVGLPGETVRISASEPYVTVGGSALDESAYVDAPAEALTWQSYCLDDLTDGDGMTLGGDEYLLLGDFRGDSYDGREAGPTAKKDIIGRMQQ